MFVASSLLYLGEDTSVQWLGTPIGNLGTVAGAAAVWCAGDQVLRAFARSCTEVLGEGHLVGRLGGEEFAFLLRGVSPGEAEDLVDRIGEHLSAAEQLAPVRPTASYGIAPLEAGLSLDELLGRADVALYRAKAGGRDRVVHHRG